MRTGQCPKCGAHEVHAGTEVTEHFGHALNAIPVTLWTEALLDYYVCGACGYIESYVRSPDKLRRIARKWPRVEEPQPVVRAKSKPQLE